MTRKCSTWASDQRQAFIYSTVRKRGHITRADIIRKFDVSPATATRDLRGFMAKKRLRLTYNQTAKRYEGKRSRSEGR